MANLETNSISALNGTVTATGLDNFSTASIVVTGTWVGTLTVQVSGDNSTFYPALALSLNAGLFKSTTTVNDQLLIPVAGLKAVQIKMTSYTSGTATIVIQANNANTIQKTLSTILGSDGTQISNTGTRLNVSADITGSGVANAAAFTSKTRVVVQTSTINLANGSYTNVFSYSGSGLLYGFNAEFNSTTPIVRLQIDGETIFDGNTIAILNGLIGTGNDAARRQAGTGIVTSASTIDWSLKQPIKYSSSVVLSADGNGSSKTFTQGLFYLSKET